MKQRSGRLALGNQLRRVLVHVWVLRTSEPINVCAMPGNADEQAQVALDESRLAGSRDWKDKRLAPCRRLPLRQWEQMFGFEPPRPIIF
jgi:hypothetical protein